MLKKNNPGCSTNSCKCVLTGCPPCDLTYVTISGMTSGGQCGNTNCCDGLNGTYVFRSSGTVTTCSFTVFSLGECNCWTYPPDLDRWRIGGRSVSGCGSPRRCSIRWRYVGAQISVEVEFEFFHYHEVCVLVGGFPDCSGFAPTGNRTYANYTKLFNNCSDIPGSTLDLTSSSSDSTSCALPYEAGICDITGLTVEVG